MYSWHNKRYLGAAHGKVACGIMLPLSTALVKQNQAAAVVAAAVAGEKCCRELVDEGVSMSI